MMELQGKSCTEKEIVKLDIGFMIPKQQSVPTYDDEQRYMNRKSIPCWIKEAAGMLNPYMV